MIVLRPNERRIPITSTQSALLKFQDHPQATRHARAAFTIGKQLRIRPQMDLDRLGRVVETVVRHHEALRTRFCRLPDGFGAYTQVNPPHRLNVERVATEAAALRRAQVIAQDYIDIVDPMFEVTVIRAGAESDIIAVKSHHLVLDGHSLGLILEDVMKAYLGIPLAPVGINVDQYIQMFDHVGKPDLFARRNAFLRRVFTEPLPPIPHIGRKAKGLRPNVDIVDCTTGGEVTMSIPPVDHAAILRRARAAGATEAAMVMAALAQTIGARGGVDDVILQAPCSLRHDGRLQNYVNFVASDVPVRARLSKSKKIEMLAAELGESVNQAIPFAPFMDFNYGGSLHDDIVSKGSYTSLFVVGSRTVDRWSRATISAPLQRPGVAGEIDLVMFKVTPLADMRVQVPRIAELDLRSFPLDGGLGLALAYDGLGYDETEASDILSDVRDCLIGR